MKKRVLILCTGNSCRSQMAEGLWRNLGQSEWEVYSAGSQPTGTVHPSAIEVMREIGIDIGGHKSKNLADLPTRDFDLVITVCDQAREACPVLPGARRTLHWPFDDPAAADPSRAPAVFRRVRDAIRERISRYLDSAETER